ncbi:MAG: CBS domain-containing protein [Chloroflexota bacterium]|nr:CBS domain-containing protein [Chloroflexota bacterium]
MSPRAAWRLESLDFPQVYDYAAGEADWLAHGLPSEGRDADTPRAGQIVRRDIPTCSLQERLGEIRDRAEAVGWDECLVVNERRVVFGRLRGAALEAPAAAIAEAVMEPGPTTIRPDESLATLVPRLRDRYVDRVIVTTPDGRLVGIVERETAERVHNEREGKEHNHD